MKKIVRVLVYSLIATAIAFGLLVTVAAKGHLGRIALIANVYKNTLTRGKQSLAYRGKVVVTYTKLLGLQAEKNIRHALGLANASTQDTTTLFGYSVVYGHLPHLLTLFEEVFAHQDYALSLKNDAPVIIDCGANVGLATLFFLMQNPNARVMAIEADPATYQMLQETIHSNDLKTVQPVYCALADKEGTITLYSACAGGPTNSVVSGHCQGKAVQVPAKRLSTLLTEHVDLLKMDIEGAEDMVMQELAASGKLALIDQMIVEFHHRTAVGKGNLATFLQSLEHYGFGYRISSSAKPPFQQPATGGDLFLIHAYRIAH